MRLRLLAAVFAAFALSACSGATAPSPTVTAAASPEATAAALYRCETKLLA